MMAGVKKNHPLHNQFAKDLAAWSEARNSLARMLRQDPDSTATALYASQNEKIDAAVRSRCGDVDLEFRAAMHDKHLVTLHRPQAMITNPVIAGRSFAGALWTALANTVPLLDLGARWDSMDASPSEVGFVTELITPTSRLPMGSAVPGSDLGFGDGSEISAHHYKSQTVASAELVTDVTFDFEEFIVDRAVPALTAGMGPELWTGDGVDAPIGLLAAVGTAVAAGSAVVTFDDIAKLVAAVPEAYRYGGNCTTLLSPGAHIDLLLENPNHAWHTQTIHGFPFRVDPGLPNPAAGVRSVVAGDFRQAYLVRTAPILAGAGDGAVGLWENDMMRYRVNAPVGGRPMVVDAARALVHPGA